MIVRRLHSGVHNGDKLFAAFRHLKRVGQERLTRMKSEGDGRRKIERPKETLAGIMFGRMMAGYGLEELQASWRDELYIRFWLKNKFDFI